MERKYDRENKKIHENAYEILSIMHNKDLIDEIVN